MQLKFALVGSGVLGFPASFLWPIEVPSFPNAVAPGIHFEIKLAEKQENKVTGFILTAILE